MADLNVSLPDPLKDWVEAQAEAGRYGSAADYVRDLIRRDRERNADLTELGRLTDEGFYSGVSDRTLDDVLDEARGRARAAGSR